MSTDNDLVKAHEAQRGNTFFRTLAWLLVPVITALSFLPQKEKVVLHTHGRYHYWGHLLIFAVVAFVAGRAARTRRERVVMFVGALAFGLGIEVAEHLVFHSLLEWKDVLVDGFGVVGGTVLAMIALRKDSL